ncbi:hypothetical protein [Noviherbaspirillum massiliense]|uniref:hypothetical protein n=1 Tax=Noviherbaspirillum massiliense TaxID=1465823 RepID=UPI00030469C1|nr:hypothetical protein [Noviherbaspirillum massiliense]
MSDTTKDRRRTSYSGLVESAIRSATKLASSHDSTTRTLANQVVSDLVLLRRELPARRQYDTKTRKA